MWNGENQWFQLSHEWMCVCVCVFNLCDQILYESSEQRSAKTLPKWKFTKRDTQLTKICIVFHCIVLFVVRWIVRCRMAKHSTSITKIWCTALQFNNHSETSNSRWMCHRSVQSYLYWYTHYTRTSTHVYRDEVDAFFSHPVVYSAQVSTRKQSPNRIRVA